MTIALSDITEATLEGTGIFDTLMRANAAHLDAEFQKNRIRGPEYATVYLGSLQAVLQAAMSFALQKEKTNKELLLLDEQILQIQAQTALVTQQKDNLVLEAVNIPKQGALLDAQAALALKQVAIADAELLIKEKQLDIAIAEVGIAQAKLANIPKEGLKLDAETALITQQKDNLVLTAENIPTEGLVLTAQKCKLDAEFNLLVKEIDKTQAEVDLLVQKNASEKAQTTAIGVDPDSVIGRQKGLYVAQTEGFSRDAEQKAAKLLVDTWNVRRTTDEGTIADGTNMLNDATVGRAVNKLLTGVGA